MCVCLYTVSVSNKVFSTSAWQLARMMPNIKHI